MTRPGLAQKRVRQERGKKSFRRGRGAEFFCALFLLLKLYHIVAIRGRTPLGEIDIVARKGRALVFVEVKARPDIAQSAEAVSKEKQKRIAAAARAFLARNPRFARLDCRFDIVLFAPWRWPLHIVNAFQDSFYPQ